MAKALYKARCTLCRKNMALVYSRKARPVCNECADKDLAAPIEDKKMKKFFDIPKELYYQYDILRSIRSYYTRFGKITDRQKEVFVEIVKKVTEKKPEKEPK